MKTLITKKQEMYSLRIHLLLIRPLFSLAIFAPCALLARCLRSQAHHFTGTLTASKSSINPAKQRPETYWKAVDFISCRSLIIACWTEEPDGRPSSRIESVFLPFPCIFKGFFVLSCCFPLRVNPSIKPILFHYLCWKLGLSPVPVPKAYCTSPWRKCP